MKQFLSYLIAVGCVVLVSVAYKKASSENYFCNHEFALCTSAKCVPDPNDASKAICFCDVLTGPNMAAAPCDTLMPSTDSNGIRSVYSTFSLEQFRQGKKVMTCPGNTPWSWCLNKRCTVDPQDPSKAICVCDVVRSNDKWVTLGGNCDKSTCETAYWSGASVSDFNEANAYLTKMQRFEKSPAKWCELEAQ